MATEQRKKVLIVDDDELMRSVLKHHLVLGGYDVLVASNGKDAMDRVREAAPDLIVVDLVMPDMNGFEMCRQIRRNEQTKNTQVIVISGLHGQADIEGARLSGANVCLSKPVNAEEFMNHVKTFLGSRFKHTP